MLGLLLSAAGCSSIGGFTGAAAGIATGTFTTNPAIGIGVGVAVQAATDETLNRVFRSWHGSEQDRIAGVAGEMPVGELRSWDIHHRLPFENEHGQLQVLRDIPSPLTDCKEILFSVMTGKGEKAREVWFDANTCRQSDGQWKWATAEPSTDRWGTLQ